MKLEHLKLRNFRGFREFEISFDPSFTVLLGGNMAGKTAVLEAAAAALGRLMGLDGPDYIGDEDVYRAITSHGGMPVLQREFPVVVDATLDDARFSKGRARWHLHRDTMEAPSRSETAEFYMLWNRPHNEDLPIIAQYGVQRHWDRKQVADDLKGIGARTDGYAGAFDIRSTHGHMAGWMRKQTYVELQQGNGYVQPQLAAVEAAVRSCVEGVTRFWFDVQFDELRLQRGDGDIQSFTMLSEGYRNMVAMVADIARRAAELNPQHERDAHRLIEGVVLIDELDLHLHPKWQRNIVGDLLRTFPKIQFIVTTHSPQIVASVSRTQVRLLDQNRLVAEEAYVEGRASDQILQDVFGVPARPEAVQIEIDTLFRLIEDEDFAEARRHLASLQQRFGPDDTDMIRARWILDSEAAQSNGGSPASP